MSENPFGVIRATPEHEDAIFRVLCSLHDENAVCPMVPEKVKQEIECATRGSKDEPAIIGLILGEDKSIEGIVWLTLQPLWYSDWYFLVERLLFVVPEHRRSTHAKRLAQFAKWCSDTMSANLNGPEGSQKEIPLIIGIMTFKSLEPKMRLYQRQFKQIGATFMHRMVPPTTFNQRHVEKVN